jgi:hypothetical protein
MKAFIDLDIFDDWFQDMFIPDLIPRRNRFSYHGPAFLIMDNCSVYRALEFNRLRSAYGIVPVWLRADWSN